MDPKKKYTVIVRESGSDLSGENSIYFTYSDSKISAVKKVILSDLNPILPSVIRSVPKREINEYVNHHMMINIFTVFSEDEFKAGKYTCIF